MRDTGISHFTMAFTESAEKSLRIMSSRDFATVTILDDQGGRSIPATSGRLNQEFSHSGRVFDCPRHQIWQPIFRAHPSTIGRRISRLFSPPDF